MQDRLKFRAWHKTRKKMYEVLHLHIGTYDNGGDWATAKGFNIITQQDMHILIQPKDCILMQCTGLKDKNGKLIYEGDLLRYPAKDEWHKKNFCAREVFWHDNDCCESHIGWQMHRVHNFGCLAGENVNPFDYQFKPKNVSKMEIIGNIYELIKEAQ